MHLTTSRAEPATGTYIGIMDGEIVGLRDGVLDPKLLNLDLTQLLNY